MPDTIPATEIRDSTAGYTPHVMRDEADARLHLAAAYRLLARLGMDDLIYTHISARVPGEPDHFLINPFGLSFDEVTPESLVKIDHEGRKVAPNRFDANAAGFVIHSAIHIGRPEVDCVMHTHAHASTCTRPCTITKAQPPTNHASTHPTPTSHARGRQVGT